MSIGRQSKNLIVGDEVTIKAVKSLVDRSQLINMLQLMNTDFRSHTRTSAYFYADRRDLQLAVGTVINDSVSITPLFVTTGGTATPEEIAFAVINTARLIQVISAEFACYDVAITSLAKMAPEVVGTAPVVCSISIPPYSGKFSGYLNLYLTRKPSNDRQNVLRDAARAIALVIFDSELAH